MEVDCEAIRVSPDLPNGVIRTHDSIEAAAPAPLRRSGRSKKPSNLMMEDANDEAGTKKSPTERPLDRSGEAPRRNPKRKAAPEVFDLPDKLLEASLAPINPEEQSEWDSWIELESDPAFFNVIMRDLGVQGAKFLELFSIDETSLSFLPKPIHGLIFLYKYAGEEDPEAAEGGGNVWFANQTTDNACATVALLNIIMNARDINLGDMLEKFKYNSASLSPPLRGHLLSNHAAIRTAHNSFARRLDFLNADLAKDNAVEKSKKKRIKITTSSRKRKNPAVDAAYHFIAYVPVDNKVWQLNGLQSHPVCIGDFENDWIEVVRSEIEGRMQLYSLDDLEFNLLALCRRPLNSLRQKLVANIRSVSLLREKMRQSTELADTSNDGDLVYEDDEEKLSKYKLSERDLNDPSVTSQLVGFIERLDQSTFTPEEALTLQQALATEQQSISAEYRAELISEEDDINKASARKKDYTLAIHEWVSRLVDHGVLKDLKEEVEGDSS